MSDYSSLPAHRAIVARDAAIVAREKSRPTARTTDGAFYTPEGSPLPPQVRVVKKASPIVNRWRYSDHRSAARHNVRTKDTVLSCPTPEEMEAWTKRMATMSGFDGGLQWRGDMQPVGKAAAQFADAIRRMKDGRQKDVLSQNFGSFLETSEADLGPSDALSFEGNDELTLAEVHAANGISKAAVGDSGGAQLRALRDETGNAIAKMQRANDVAWAKKPATQATPAKLLESASPARSAKSWWKG
jgi:hypothetical protein